MKGLQGTGLGFEFKRGPLYSLAAMSVLNFSVSSHARATSAAKTIFRRVEKKKEKDSVFYLGFRCASYKTEQVRVKKRAEYIHRVHVIRGSLEKLHFFREAKIEEIKRAGS